ncbi:DUF2292 domain-containing protein [Candidatus Parcubacteria bacterium]|nr:MAG: DUF2292 domain-containing protein [Candidatus Woesebacteria bacterium]RJQ29974.1 MAG: DUF2292 domain-containing protein [Candidatus Parcubacteria bacterium]
MLQQNPKPEEKLRTDLSLAELKLIDFIRKLKWGSAEITVQNSQPVIVKVAVQTVKLT